MWNAIVQRYRDEELAKGRELSEADCKRLRAMGLKIPKGVDPRQLYCFQTIESKDDGGLMQVLRRLEEARGLTHRPARRSHTVTQTTELVEVGTVKEVEAEPLLAIKVLPANVPSQQSVRTSIKVVESPVKPSSTRGVKRSSIQISVQEDPTVGTPAKSSRKRKESPIGGLFSSRSRTPSPGTKSRRTSVLNKFETPDQPTVPTTPQTLPVPPKRLSLTSVHAEVSTTEDEEEQMLKPKHLSFDDGLMDDTEDDSRACCDQGMFVPIWDALERTTSRVQNAWEEVRDLSSSLTLKPVSSLDLAPLYADADADAVDLLVFEGDVSKQGNCDQLMNLCVDSVECEPLGVRTRRQRQEMRRFSATAWRLW